MKKGQEYTGIVDHVEFPNKGIVYVEEERVIVKGAVKGQKVRFVINKNRKNKAEGRLIEVVKKSEYETAVPECSHFGLCGGCTYQTLPYDYQLKMKEEQIKHLIDGVAEEGYSFEGIAGSPKETGYRNKMEFSFGDEYKDGPLVLGLHKKGSTYDIVPVSDCKIVHADYNKILKCVGELCNSYKLPFFHKMSHKGYLRHLLVRRAENTGEIMTALVTSSQTFFDGEGGSGDIGCFDQDEFLQSFVEGITGLELEGTITGILHIVNDSLGDVVKSDRTDVLYGRDYIVEELLGLKFKISVFSFFQTNSSGAEVLYDTVRGFIRGADDKALPKRIFDLYSGTGTIAQILASAAEKVVGVEIVEEAVEAARVNAELNGLANCEFIAGDVLKAVDEIDEVPDLIVVDPPREGIHPKALVKIVEFGAGTMVYISCNPISLVRDLAVLKESGYRVLRVGGVDMFPMAGHVEIVVLLSKDSEIESLKV